MTTPTTYALIGAAGFVAPRHMRAIADTGGRLIGALDPHDSVGVLDQYQRDVEFFTESAAFDRWLRKARPDWLVVCSPNYLHAAHVRQGMLAGCNVLCEKPFAINPENLDELQALQEETAVRVVSVLQLRYLFTEELKKYCRQGHHAVQVHYTTPRGPWYHQSWKSQEDKSGGIVTNIGIHLFDALIYLFGRVLNFGSTEIQRDQAHGKLQLERAEVYWKLSIKPDEPASRRFVVDGNDCTVRGFEGAHLKVYTEMLAGRGFGIEHARPAVELCWKLRGLSGAE